MIFNFYHEANAHLTLEVTDREAGKHLQRLRWLDVSLVGEIPER